MRGLGYTSQYRSGSQSTNRALNFALSRSNPAGQMVQVWGGQTCSLHDVHDILVLHQLAQDIRQVVVECQQGNLAF